MRSPFNHHSTDAWTSSLGHMSTDRGAVKPVGERVVGAPVGAPTIGERVARRGERVPSQGTWGVPFCLHRAHFHATVLPLSREHGVWISQHQSPCAELSCLPLESHWQTFVPGVCEVGKQEVSSNCQHTAFVFGVGYSSRTPSVVHNPTPVRCCCSNIFLLI